MMQRLLILILCFGFSSNVISQKVGVVLSGGGATGFAHIGMLKALEENNIPIDYITGTSSGALIGGLYASGYSPSQIEQIVLSESFQIIANGDIEKEYKYFIESEDDDASLFTLKFSKDSIFQKALATNVLNPTFLDIQMMKLLGLNPRSSENSFDSLFVPFRCVASDIVTKKSILFESGNLNQAIRASMTYPFFISPIEVDGVLLFDGGLYNNFPADEMYNEFLPDYIIGCNVSYNEPPPVEDDLMSQVRNMFSSHSNYSLPCQSGIIIEPQLDEEVGTFEFDKIQQAIQIGYDATIAKIDSIKMFVKTRVTKEELLKSRELYATTKIKMNITDINAIGLEEEQAGYIENKLLKSKKQEVLEYPELKKRYLRLYQSEHIRSMFPTLNSLTDSTQSLNVVVKKEKPFKTSFGGHYSSRPVNTGFLSVSYSDFKVTPITIYANTYFGKFYGSVKTGLKFYLPTNTVSYLEPVFTMNRLDYFRSFATFFEDVKPSYIVQNENHWALKYHIATSSKGKLTFDFANGRTEDDYYQIDDFTNADTADYTSFLYYSPGVEFSLNSLNRKQFASGGQKLLIKAKFIHGIEETEPGSTSINQTPVTSIKNWAYLKMSYKSYFMSRGVYRLGIMLEGVYSIQPYYQNYTASVLSAHAFQPTPDSKLGFYNDFRSNKYLGGGLMNIFTIKDKVDIRVEAYVFQPIIRILDDNGVAIHGKTLESNRFGIGSASIIYHSPIGPLRATLNYTGSESKLEPLSFQVSFGYVIFNDSGIK